MAVRAPPHHERRRRGHGERGRGGGGDLRGRGPRRCRRGAGRPGRAGAARDRATPRSCRRGRPPSWRARSRRAARRRGGPPAAAGRRAGCVKESSRNDSSCSGWRLARVERAEQAVQPAVEELGVVVHRVLGIVSGIVIVAADRCILSPAPATARPTMATRLVDRAVLGQGSDRGAAALAGARDRGPGRPPRPGSPSSRATTSPSPCSSTKRALKRSCGMVWRLRVTTTGTPWWKASASEPGPGLGHEQVARRHEVGDAVGEAHGMEPAARRAGRAPRASPSRPGLSPQIAITCQLGAASSRRAARGSISGEPLPPKSSITVKASSGSPSSRAHARARVASGPSGRSAGAAPCPRRGRCARAGCRSRAPAAPPRPSPRSRRRARLDPEVRREVREVGRAARGTALRGARPRSASRTTPLKLGITESTAAGRRPRTCGAARARGPSAGAR